MDIQPSNPVSGWILDHEKAGLLGRKQAMMSVT
jgi:hypothetical protein